MCCSRVLRPNAAGTPTHLLGPPQLSHAVGGCLDVGCAGQQLDCTSTQNTRANPYRQIQTLHTQHATPCAHSNTPSMAHTHLRRTHGLKHTRLLRACCAVAEELWQCGGQAVKQPNRRPQPHGPGHFADEGISATEDALPHNQLGDMRVDTKLRAEKEPIDLQREHDRRPHRKWKTAGAGVTGDGGTNMQHIACCIEPGAACVGVVMADNELCMCAVSVMNECDSGIISSSLHDQTPVLSPLLQNVSGGSGRLRTAHSWQRVSLIDSRKCSASARG